MSFYGLVQQRGPWKETRMDKRNLRTVNPTLAGGDIPAGGTLHAGHGYWESATDPYQLNGSLPPPKMSKYVQRSIIARDMIPVGKVFYTKPTAGIKQSVGVIAGGRPQTIGIHTNRLSLNVERETQTEDSYGDGDIEMGTSTEVQADQMLNNSFAVEDIPHINLEPIEYTNDGSVTNFAPEEIERKQLINLPGAYPVDRGVKKIGKKRHESTTKLPKYEDAMNYYHFTNGGSVPRSDIPRKEAGNEPAFKPPRKDLVISPEKYVESNPELSYGKRRRESVGGMSKKYRKNGHDYDMTRKHGADSELGGKKKAVKPVGVFEGVTNRKRKNFGGHKGSKVAKTIPDTGNKRKRGGVKTTPRKVQKVERRGAPTIDTTGPGTTQGAFLKKKPHTYRDDDIEKRVLARENRQKTLRKRK